MTDDYENSLHLWVVHSDYIDNSSEDAWISWQLGVDTHIAIALDLGFAVRNVTRDDLAGFGLRPEEAFDIGVKNIEKAHHSGRFEVGVVPLESGGSFGYCEGDWTAPAGAMMGVGFFKVMQQHLAADEVIVVIPNQELAVAFKPDSATLADRALADFLERRFQDHPKPVSLAWHVLNGGWPQAYSGPLSF